MRSEKAWYWLAAGVLALGINGAYQDGQFGFVHRLTDRASAMMSRTSERGLQFVSMAELMLGRGPANTDRAEVAIQRIQSKIVCERMAQAQRQMAMAHVREQITEARMQQKMNLAQMKMDKVRMITIDRANHFRDCSGLGHVVVDVPYVKVDLSNLPNVEIPDLPDFEMPSDKANGPI